MTIGLVISDKNGIYLAVESEGLPVIQPALQGIVLNSVLDSKIISIQRNPDYALLVAGGLEHWSYVATHYSKSDSLQGAAQNIVELLNRDECMTSANRAFGLLCGYDESGEPTCFRIERNVGDSHAEENQVLLFETPQPLGSHDIEAVAYAQQAIDEKKPRLDAIAEAIQLLLDLHPSCTRAPIHVRVLRPQKA